MSGTTNAASLGGAETNNKEARQGSQAVRVSVSEAARLFGINTRTIRRAIKRQEVVYVVVRNRYKISFASLVAWSQRSATIKNKRDARGIGQWVDQWKITNVKFSPRPPNEGK